MRTKTFIKFAKINET